MTKFSLKSKLKPELTLRRTFKCTRTMEKHLLMDGRCFYMQSINSVGLIENMLLCFRSLNYFEWGALCAYLSI